MAYYLVPPNGREVSIAPSLARIERGVGTNSVLPRLTNGVISPKSDQEKDRRRYNSNDEIGNPSVIPEAVLRKFHFTFLIRHPRSSIPSFYRCTVPPLDNITGFHNFMPSEAGYHELRRLFDYLRSVSEIGPDVAGQTEPNTDNETEHRAERAQICVVDADDLLDKPNEVIETFCKSVGIKYNPAMLIWDSKEDLEHAKQKFEKWNGFHEDALDSSSLKPRQHVSLTEFRSVQGEETGIRFVKFAFQEATC